MDYLLHLLNTNFFGSVFGALTAFFIFRMGLRAEKKKAERKEKKRLNGVKIYFKNLHRMLLGTLVSQRQKLDEYAHNILNENEQQILLIIEPGFNTKLIREIASKDLHQIYWNETDSNEIKEEAINNFLNYSAALDGIDHAIHTITNSNVEIRIKLAEIREQWNQHYVAFKRDFNRFTGEVDRKGLKSSDDFFLGFISNHLVTVQKKIENNNSIEAIYRELYYPVLVFLRDNSDNLKYDFRVDVVYDHLDIVKKTHADYLNFKEVRQKEAQFLSKHLQGSKEIFDLCVKSVFTNSLD